jgi:hypothetical protein
VRLARAELAPILENAKTVAIEVGLVVGFAIFAALLLVVGLPLFLGEWVFGSMGWGIALGVALAIAVIVVCISLILKDDSPPIVLALVAGAAVGFLIGLVLWLNLTNLGWTRLAESLNLGIDPEWRVLAVAVGVSAIVGAILGAILAAWRGGVRTILTGLVLGAILGVLIGAFTALTFGPQAAVALGLLTWLLVFALLVAVDLYRSGVDAEAIKSRFYPAQTIESTKETLEWLQRQSPMGPGS